MACEAWTAARELLLRSEIANDGFWRWKPLDSDGQTQRAAADRTVQRWLRAYEGALKWTAPSALPDLKKSAAHILRVTDRSRPGSGPGHWDILQVIRTTEQALISHLDILQRIAVPKDRERVWLADTNALIYRYQLHTWPASQAATLVIPLTVVAELDKLKRRAETRDKAQSLIQQIKQYRGRGDAFDRVSLAGNLGFRMLSTWPDTATIGGGLQADHADDQILAAALELSWQHLSWQVTLVTGDANLQNKAAIWGVAYVDPDAPGKLVAPPSPADPGPFVARSKLIYPASPSLHRNRGDRFLAVLGQQAQLDAWLASGVIERD